LFRIFLTADERFQNERVIEFMLLHLNVYVIVGVQCACVLEHHLYAGIISI